jgi:hypothetical protein
MIRGYSMDIYVGMFVAELGGAIVGVGFFLMAFLIYYSKLREPAGAFIGLRTTQYIVLVGLASILLGFCYMLTVNFLTK